MSTKARRVLGDDNVPIHYAVSDSPEENSQYRQPGASAKIRGDKHQGLGHSSLSDQSSNQGDMVGGANASDKRRFSFYINGQIPAELEHQTIATPIAGIRTPRVTSPLHSHPTQNKPLRSWVSNQSLESSARGSSIRRDTPSTPNLYQRFYHDGEREEHHQRPSTANSSIDATLASRNAKSKLLHLFYPKSHSMRYSHRSTRQPEPIVHSSEAKAKNAQSTEQHSVTGVQTLKSMSSNEGFTALASDTFSEVSQDVAAAETPVVKGGPSSRYANTRKSSVEEALYISAASSTLSQELYVSDEGIVHERPGVPKDASNLKTLNAEALARLEASGLGEPRTHSLRGITAEKRAHQGPKTRKQVAKEDVTLRSGLQGRSFFTFSDSDDEDPPAPSSVRPSQSKEVGPSEQQENEDNHRSSTPTEPNPRLVSRWSPSTILSTADHVTSNRTSWISSSPTVYHPAASNVESLANSLTSLRANRADESHLMAVTSEEAAFLSSMRRKRASIRRHLVNEGYRLAIEEEYRSLSGSRQRSTSSKNARHETKGDVEVRESEKPHASYSPPRGRPTSIKLTTTAHLSQKPENRVSTLKDLMWRNVDDDISDDGDENDGPITPTHRRTHGDFAPLNAIISSKVTDSNDEFDDDGDHLAARKPKVHHRKRLSRLLGMSQPTSSSWWDNPGEDEVFYTPKSDKGVSSLSATAIEEERKRLAKKTKKRRSAALDVMAAWGDLGGD